MYSLINFLNPNSTEPMLGAPAMLVVSLDLYLVLDFKIDSDKLLYLV